MMISYCKQQEAGGGVGAEAGTTGAEQGSRVPHTFHEVRKSIVQATQRRGCKTVTELEMQVNGRCRAILGLSSRGFESDLN